MINARTLGVMAICAGLAACNADRANDNSAMIEPTNNTVLDGQITVPPVVGPMEAAPEGLPSRIAREVIAGSGQVCAEVSDANREADGTIVASCSGGERYRVYTAPGSGPVAATIQ